MRYRGNKIGLDKQMNGRTNALDGQPKNLPSPTLSSGEGMIITVVHILLFPRYIQYVFLGCIMCGLRWHMSHVVWFACVCVSVYCAWAYKWAVQKRVNWSRCHSGCCLVSPRNHALDGVKVRQIHLLPWRVTRWRCGLLSKLFDHLFIFQ